MPTYIMLSTLTPEGCRRSRPTRTKSRRSTARSSSSADIKAEWATLGHVDFISVIEAPDEGTMARVSLELGSRGTGRYETLAAIGIERLHRVAVAPAARERTGREGGEDAYTAA